MIQISAWKEAYRLQSICLMNEIIKVRSYTVQTLRIENNAEG